MRPSLLLDSGVFIARYWNRDPFAEPLLAFLEAEEARRDFGHWYTVDAVVAEAYNFLRREAGLAVAREFLRNLAAGEHPKVLKVPWEDVAALLLEAKPGQLGRGFSFTDASLVVAARSLSLRHILTVNPRDFRPFGLTPLPN